MKLMLKPQRSDALISIAVHGDVITVDGDAMDFSQLPEGATLPKSAINSAWIAGDVTRFDGVLQVPLVLPNGPDASQAARFPQPITITKNGPVELPQ